MKKLLITNLFLGPSLDSPARQQGRGQLTPVRRPKPVFKMSPVLAGSGMTRNTDNKAGGGDALRSLILSGLPICRSVMSWPETSTSRW